jgi:hypothetical protein
MRAVLRIRKEPHYRRLAFELGLKKVGFHLTEIPRPADASDWLVLWNRQGAGELEADLWEKQGGTVIVCENGYLQKLDKTYYAISVHGHNGSGWFPVDDSEERFEKLGFELMSWSGDGDYDLICGQRGIGSRTMKSPPQWAEKRAKELQARGKATKLRQHPGNFVPKVPLTRDLEGAAACHVWSSAAGVRALVEGVPVYHSAPHWICAGAGPVSRGMILNRMAHGQWHHEEIATGEPFARIIANRSKATW